MNGRPKNPKMPTSPDIFSTLSFCALLLSDLLARAKRERDEFFAVELREMRKEILRLRRSLEVKS